MKLDAMTNDSKEIFIEGHDISVTVNTWSNLGGANIMVEGKGRQMVMAASFTWEEMDLLIAALSVAKAV